MGCSLFTDQGSSLLHWSDEPCRNHRGCRKALWRIHSPLGLRLSSYKWRLGHKRSLLRTGWFWFVIGVFKYISGEQQQTSPPNPQSVSYQLSLLKRRNNSMHILLEKKITLFPGKSDLVLNNIHKEELIPKP